MKILFSLLIFVSCAAHAQHNYFVHDSLLLQITPTSDSCYLGTTLDNDLIKVDSNFNYLWSWKTLELGIVDMEMNANGDYAVLSRKDSAFVLREFDPAGSVLNELELPMGETADGELEVSSDGYVLALNAAKDDTSSRSIICMRMDSLFNIQWTQIVDQNTAAPFGMIRMNVHDDTVTVLAVMGNWNEKHTIFYQYDPLGNMTWANHLGSECSDYYDFERISDGKFVLAGAVEGDEVEAMKVSVTNPVGYILTTKQKAFSGSDSGTNISRIAVLSDDRYVVSNNYWQGPGTGYEGCLIYFDNHKPVYQWNYSPQTIPDDDVTFELWNVDWNDRILFTGRTTSFSELTEEKTVGRIRWTQDQCGIGFSSTYNMQYRLDTTEVITLDSYMHPFNWVSHSSTLTPSSWSAVNPCGSAGVANGPSEINDHLYGTLYWFCDFVPMNEDTTSSGGSGADLTTDEMDVLVYPNPFNDQFQVNAEIPMNYQLYNVVGQVIQSGNLVVGINTISVDAPAGIYIMKVTDERGRLSSVRLSKR